MAKSKNPDVETMAGQSRKKKGKKRSQSDLDSSIGGNGSPSEMVDEGAGEYHMDEPSMEEKLASLDLVNNNIAKNSTSQELPPMSKPPSADSVHILLKQALHAEDHALLLDCLYTRDEKVIAKSISLLNPADVLKLLNSLISMTQARGAVLVCALPWLRSLLGQHASSIASQESSLVILNSLYQLIQSRISTFGSALQLSSTLDYLFSGIPDDDADEENMPPAIVYEDKDTDEESDGADAMETDEENDDELGAVINSRDSDVGEVMSD